MKFAIKAQIEFFNTSLGEGFNKPIDNRVQVTLLEQGKATAVNGAVMGRENTGNDFPRPGTVIFIRGMPIIGGSTWTFEKRGVVEVERGEDARTNRVLDREEGENGGEHHTGKSAY